MENKLTLKYEIDRAINVFSESYKANPVADPRTGKTFDHTPLVDLAYQAKIALDNCLSRREQELRSEQGERAIEELERLHQLMDTMTAMWRHIIFVHGFGDIELSVETSGLSPEEKAAVLARSAKLN